MRASCFFFPPDSLVITSSFCGVLLLNLSQVTGAPSAFLKQISSNSGRPCVGLAESQSSGRRDFSKRRALVGSRQRLVAKKMCSVKVGRKSRWSGLPSFSDLAFAGRWHLENYAKKVRPAVVLRNISLGALGLVG